MIKHILIGIFIIIAVISCNKEGENCSPDSIYTTWTPGKEIALTYNIEFQRNEYAIVDGNKRLFEYNHSGAQCDDRYDDEWSEKLIFMLSNETGNFEFSDEEILSSNCFYQAYGAWVSHAQHQVNKGSIKGEKISDNKWEIVVNVEVSPLSQYEEPIYIDFTAIFTE